VRSSSPGAAHSGDLIQTVGGFRALTRKLARPVVNALVRDSRKEIGLTPLLFRKLGVIKEFNPQAHGDAIHHMYAALSGMAGNHILGDEHTEIHWFGIDAANGCI
jgi:hypothetical protein